MDTNTSNNGANLQNASVVLPLTAFTKEPDKGFRLSRVIFKADKSGNKAQASKGVIIPDTLSIAECEKFPALAAVMLSAVKGIQDDLIRSMVLKNQEQVWHDSITAEKLEAFAVESNENLGRLTLEEVTEFCSKNAAVILAAYATVKNLQEIAEEKQAGIIKGLSEILARLTDSKATFTEAQESVLSLIVENTESEVKAKLSAKLSAAVKRRKDTADALDL